MTCLPAKTAGGQSAGITGTGPWPPALHAAQARVLASADVETAHLLPAWRRYAGSFYRHAEPEPELADAATSGNVLIISGGYGLVRADEPIGTYNKVLRLGDRPQGLLESLLVQHARDTAATSVVAFAAHSTDYAQLLRRAPWHSIGVSALLVTCSPCSTTSPNRGSHGLRFWR